MKKNISINLQGIIFHIEEDGYEVLSRYLAEVKAHFASYRGSDDIVADIEGRIAELFSARLSPSQQVISLSDVESMMAKMGRVRDFAADTDEDEETAEPASDTFTSTGTGPTASAYTAPAATAAATGPKRLYRDMAHRKVAGVAAGIAQYFAVNPLWIRLAFLLFAVITPAITVWENEEQHGHFRFGSWGLLAYILLWIVLPKRYDAPTPDDSLLNSGPLAGRRLFRDTDTGKVAGVAAGLAAYLNIDVTLVRVLLLAGLFAGGFTFILYIILWVVLPEAKTVSDKMRMRGTAITLQGFANNVSSFTDEVRTAGRPIGTFVEDTARGLQPAVNFVGSFIRIAVGLLLTILGFGLLVGLSILAGVALGLIPNSDNIIAGDLPAHVLLNGLPAWGVLSGFLALGIPALSLLLGGVNLLSRRSIMNRTVSLSLLGLWLLSIVGLTMTVASQLREFQYEMSAEEVTPYPALTTPVLFLDSRSIDRHTSQWPDVRLAAADSGRTVEVLRIMSAKGASDAEARRTASTSIAYAVRISGDSALIFDDHFSFQPDARFRSQELDVVVRLPRDRSFRISRGFAGLVGDESFVGGHQPDEPEKYRYRLRGNQLECMGCPPAERDEDDNDDASDSNNEDEENGVELDFGDDEPFSTDPSDYPSAHRDYGLTGFQRISMEGGYHVIISQGSEFKVQADGRADDLDRLEIENRGNELLIRPRHRGLFGFNTDSHAKPVLVRVQLPELGKVEMRGGINALVMGFNKQDVLTADLTGASQLRLAANCRRLDLDLTGASQAYITGRADALQLDGTGACQFNGTDFTATTANIDLTGASNARLRVEKVLRADLTGASNLEYSGNPSEVDIDDTGASHARRLDN